MSSYRLERLAERLVVWPFFRGALGGAEPGSKTSAVDVEEVEVDALDPSTAGAPLEIWDGWRGAVAREARLSRVGYIGDVHGAEDEGRMRGDAKARTSKVGRLFLYRHCRCTSRGHSSPYDSAGYFRARCIGSIEFHMLASRAPRNHIYSITRDPYSPTPRCRWRRRRQQECSSSKSSRRGCSLLLRRAPSNLDAERLSGLQREVSCDGGEVRRWRGARTC